MPRKGYFYKTESPDQRLLPSSPDLMSQDLRGVSRTFQQHGALLAWNYYGDFIKKLSQESYLICHCLMTKQEPDQG